jgi:hypothetical protein
MKLLCAVLALSACAGSFAGGVFYANATRLNVPKFKLMAPMSLQGDSTEVGRIPPGASLYRFGRSAEVATFFMLVNVAPGYLDQLERVDGRPVTGDPLDAYPSEVAARSQ